MTHALTSITCTTATTCATIVVPSWQGAWNVFTVSATGIDEADPFTGERSSMCAAVHANACGLASFAARADASRDGPELLSVPCLVPAPDTAARVVFAPAPAFLAPSAGDGLPLSLLLLFKHAPSSPSTILPTPGEERVVWVYSSTEEQQLWDASAQPPGGDEGGCYWLPGGVVVSLRMVDNYVPADSAEAQGDGSSSSEDESASGGVGSRQERKGQEHAVSNGNGNGSGKAAGARDYPRGLCLGMLWSWREGSVSQVEREYDGYGYLREVRLGQAVKGGWSGGRM